MLDQPQFQHRLCGLTATPQRLQYWFSRAFRWWWLRRLPCRACDTRLLGTAMISPSVKSTWRAWNATLILIVGGPKSTPSITVKGYEIPGSSSWFVEMLEPRPEMWQGSKVLVFGLNRARSARRGFS